MSKVIAAISGVMHDISQVGIGKNRQNNEQKYSFRGIDDVLNALSPLFVRHKLVIIPVVESRELVQSTTSKGNPLWKVTVKVNYHIYAEDGSSLVATTYGEAMDSADKATNKALSAAYKYLAIQLFAIPVEGQPDADFDTPQSVPLVTTEQATEIKRLLRAKGVGEDELLTYLSGKAGYEITTIESIPAEAYDLTVKSLTKSKEPQQ